jgi:hypothetical protein
MKTGFTGTQRGMTIEQGRVVLELLREELTSEGQLSELHHGDCIGADEQAHKIALALGVRTVIWPPTNGSKRAWCKADVVKPADEYLLRNRSIAYFTDRLIACPRGKEEEMRSGTWATVRYARSYKRPIFIIYPDGSVNES